MLLLLFKPEMLKVLMFTHPISLNYLIENSFSASFKCCQKLQGRNVKKKFNATGSVRTSYLVLPSTWSRCHKQKLELHSCATLK